MIFMAKILFFVCGVGMGHAGRSSVIIKELMKKHKVKIVSYADGYNFLEKEFSEIEKLDWYEYKYKKNLKIWKLGTLASIAPKFPITTYKNYKKVMQIWKEFSPEIVISDFDYNGLIAARLKKVPCILISNLHLVDYVVPKLSAKELAEFVLTDQRMLKAYQGANYYMIMSIFKPREVDANKFFYYPVMTKEIIKAKPKDKNYFLVYFQKNKLPMIVPLLKAMKKHKFVVYGLNENKIDENIEFKKFARWTKDIANCKGLICHGGMSTLSEAVILKKPVYVASSKDWFERFHNGFLAQMQGFGVVEDEATLSSLEEFAHKIPEYKKNLKAKNIQPSNKEFMQKLEELIKELALNRAK